MNSNNTTKVNRGERILAKLEHKGLTPEAIAWLKIATDPFHDKQIPNLEGYPDSQTAPSVVQIVKQSMTIAKPSGLPAGNWDFMVHFHDSLQTNLAYPCGQNENHIRQNTSTWSSATPIMHSGGISIVAHSSSDTTNPIWMFSSDLTKGVAMSGISTDPAFLKGRTRCIARGFELRNTTAEIYKQGSICAYRQPTAPEEFAAYEMHVRAYVTPENSEEEDSDESRSRESKKKTKGKTRVEDLPGAYYETNCTRDLRYSLPPPKNLAEALLLPGSAQWEAKHGCYVVQTQYDMDNPPTYFAPRGTLVNLDETNLPFPSTLVPEVDQSLYTQTVNGIYSPYGEAYAQSDAHVSKFFQPTYALQKFIPFNPCGVIVTGLNDQTTFTLNWNEVFERTVSSEQKDLVTLAKPSAPINLVALELYSALWRELPVGVPVEQNGFGDWFLGVCDSIVDTISEIGRPILGAITGYQEQRVQQKAPVKAVQPAQVTNTWTPPPKDKRPGKSVKSKRTGKKKGLSKTSGQVTRISGPRLPNNKFKGKNRDR